jgi:hypothetical protein
MYTARTGPVRLIIESDAEGTVALWGSVARSPAPTAQA